MSNSLRIAYIENYGLGGGLEFHWKILVPDEPNTLYHKSHKFTFVTPGELQVAVLKMLISYLETKEDATVMENWICKALKAKSFSKEEFMTLDSNIQTAVCYLSKFFEQGTNWSRAEECLKPPTRTFCGCVIPDEISINVMTYVKQSSTTALVCRAWAYYTRNVSKQLLINDFNNQARCQVIRRLININMLYMTDNDVYSKLPDSLKIVLEPLRERANETNDLYSKRILSYIKNCNYRDSNRLLKGVRTFTSNYVHFFRMSRDEPPF